ncbi:HlyD family type I secretion periplasmic adaptor subunit [Paracoccus xiamenensis]|uniref:HlyD family type I secretion periplasmic adaptor subunit n=1 Tax=Paracoccus xiamenensis TaxID=2714901 RepID=UPI0014091BAB|nr:HlyD family type I secretion periplasmic adaptor subunit [Paracoccus xiamenensis]NHF74387.1 HlyD family type I secretion periplasmic adaptor subunit [Paracoccus xiamenensis]
MRYEKIDRSLGASLRRQLLLGFAVIVILIGGGGSVAALTEISGAVVGMGKLIVEGRPKNVQHLDGGTIREIFVREGETVEAGQVLFRLDPTVVEANLQMVNSQIDALLAQEARLTAEILDLDVIEFPDELAESDDPRRVVLVRGQKELKDARADARAGQRRQLTAQISQLNDKIKAHEAQRVATERAVVLADEELNSKKSLNERGLTSANELRAAERLRSDLDAEIATLDAQLSETREEILRRELERTQIDERFREEILTMLDEKRTELARLTQEKVAAEDRMTRLAITAPIGGQLHELAIHTLGQVISPGERLVTVVAGNDRLVVETRLPPQDVDQVYGGQTARLRFPGLDQRKTPQLIGSVIDVSPDASTDEQTGSSYFLARLSVDAEELARIQHSELRPGMPVEVFIETQPRTILSYLVKPMVDQIQHAFREG